MYRHRIENETFDQERALYASTDTEVVKCHFDGPADGESAFKESKNIRAEACYFNLRYPFWHDSKLEIDRCELTELCRASLWYTTDAKITNSKLHGIKALRECNDIRIANSSIQSAEFGWFCRNVTMRNTAASGEYFMMRCSGLDFSDVTLNGKYSFQYIQDAVLENCNFNTKDAFWHAKNVVVRNSVIRGEYLAWYCEDVTFDNCVIIGTQPLCYCKNLKLINCRMEENDLAFEKSQVEATVNSHIISIKNPTSGFIRAASAGCIIRDDPESLCEIQLGE